jgi:hypothetical protein
MSNSLRWIALTVLAGCLVFAAAAFRFRPRSDLVERETLKHQTGSRTIVFPVTGATGTGTLTIAFALESGAAAWTFSDPGGHAHWNETLDRGSSRDETRRFDLMPGNWTLKLSLQDATGQYDARWLIR